MGIGNIPEHFIYTRIKTLFNRLMKGTKMNIKQILNFLENIGSEYSTEEQEKDKITEIIEIDIEIVTTKRTVIDTILS